MMRVLFAFRHFSLGCLWLATLVLPSASEQVSLSLHPSRQLKPYQTERFDLSASPGCADGYPATIDEGRFITSAGGSFPVPWGHFLQGDWRGAAIGWVGGDEQQPAPEVLEIRWFSYTEDKFYEGHFPLPQERIHALLKRGFWDADSKQQKTYNNLTASVAPTGAVYVWLNNGQSNSLLIGRYQASAVVYDYAKHRPGVNRAADVRETRAELAPKVRHEIATGTVSAKKWDAYLKTYPWKLEFSRPISLTDFALGYVNAEASGDPPNPDLGAHVRAFLLPNPKPVPTFAMLYVTGADGRKRLLRVEGFDERETMAAFQALAAKYPQQVISLFVDVNERLSKGTLSLRVKNQIIPLTKSPLEFVSLP